MFIRPDAELPAHGARVTVTPLKEHYIFDPDRPEPTLGAKTRRNYDDGRPGAVLIAARGATETHLLHLLTSPRAMRSCGTHLLLHAALRL